MTFPRTTLRDRIRRRIADPTTIMRLGMSSLLVFSLLYFLHPGTALWVDVVDAARGLFLGLSIALNLWSVRLNRRRRCTAIGSSDEGE